MNYNKNCEWLNPFEGGGASRGDANKCISMVYDVNGGKKPNKAGSDIVLLNAELGCVAKVESTCITKVAMGNTYDAIDTSTTEGCDEAKSFGLQYCYGVNDYYAGAAKLCGGRENLISPEDLAKVTNDLYNVSSCTAVIGNTCGSILDTSKLSKYGLSFSYWIWTSIERSSSTANNRYFSNTYSHYGGDLRGRSLSSVLCVK